MAKVYVKGKLQAKFKVLKGTINQSVFDDKHYIVEIVNNTVSVYTRLIEYTKDENA